MKNLEPKGLWQNFYSLTQIPRPSGKKAEVSAFLKSFGEQLGLETCVDPIGNVLIRKPASKGMENHPGVILQAHMDMVPQKESAITFDFEKDPIQAYITEDGQWVTAKGTTLGADNGIGVAAAMAILQSKQVVHPPLEAFFTVDEETGMYGANALEPGVLKGDILLNLDSETEGECYMGCAGGLDAKATFDYQDAQVEAGDIAIKVTVKGCKGGHSGCDIHMQRANAIKLLFQFLKDAVANYDARLVSVEGGSLRNAIPREATAVITVMDESYDDIMDLVAYYEDLFLQEYQGIDDDIMLLAEQVDCPATEMPEDVQDFLIHAITICPTGVYRMIPEMPGVVETSNNMAIISTQNNQVTVQCLLRSSSDTRKEELKQMVESTFSLAGAKVVFDGGYAGWQPNFKSRVLQVVKQVYKQEFGVEPKTTSIHAGLECAILGRNYPNMDMISFGPTIEHPHTPDERVNIATVARFYQLIVAILKSL